MPSFAAFSPLRTNVFFSLSLQHQEEEKEGIETSLVFGMRPASLSSLSFGLSAIEFLDRFLSVSKICAYSHPNENERV